MATRKKSKKAQGGAKRAKHAPSRPRPSRDTLQPIPQEHAANLPPLPNSLEMYDSLEAQKRSLMHKQKVLCNGEANGKQCKHYWTLVQIASSATPDHLRSGERTRMCVYQIAAEPIIFDDGREGMATSCNRYEPDTSPLHDVRGPYKDEPIPYVEGATIPRGYDPREEEYRPIPPHLIKRIQAGEITSLRQLEQIEEEERRAPPAPAAPPAPIVPQDVSVDEALDGQEQHT